MFIKKPHLSLSLLIALVILITCTGCSTYQSKTTQNPRWWKGNLHTHSLWSDGRDFPEMIVKWYKDNGYHFLSLSDHNILSQGQKWIDVNHKHLPKEAIPRYRKTFGEDWLEFKTEDDKLKIRLKPLSEFRCFFEESGRFLLIQGEEITDKKAHVNAINLVNVIPPQGGNTTLEVLQNNINAVLEQEKETGQEMFPHINHPNFKWQLTAEAIMQVKGEKFFEVYNSGHAMIRNKGDEYHTGTERMWDIILTKRLAELNLPVMYGIATDDAHRYFRFGAEFANPGRGWVVVRATHLTPENLIKAMEAGDFYASTGIVLKDIKYDSRKLTVKIKPENGVSYTTQFIGTLKGYDKTSKPVVDANDNEINTTRIYSSQIGEVLAQVTGTVATYNFRGNEIYVRANVISTKPKLPAGIDGDFESAWVQPVVITDKHASF